MANKYTDINFNYSLDSKGAVVSDHDAIRYSLYRLFKTPKGSVPFNREYGTSLHNLLFEVSEGLDLTDIKVLLYREITEWEPRVELNPLNINIEKVDTHTYRLTCTFVVPELGNQTSSLVTTITEK